MKRALILIVLSFVLSSISAQAPEEERAGGQRVTSMIQQVQGHMLTMRQQMERIHATEDPVERQRQRLGHGGHHQGLGQTGHADEEGVPPGQNGRQDALDGLILAHDALGHLVPEAFDRLGQVLELLDVVWCCLRNGHLLPV